MRTYQLFERAHEAISESSHIAIGPHENPDGDALGTLCALALVAERHFGKEVIRYSKDPVPQGLAFLPGSEKIVSLHPAQSDLFIGLDYGDVRRLGLPTEFLADTRMVTFDHHPHAGQIGDICIIDPSASSTAELLYWFLRYHGIRIDTDVATCLLTGMITDTGGFLHSNTSHRTLLAAAGLSRFARSGEARHLRTEVTGGDVTSLLRRFSGIANLPAAHATGRVLARARVQREYPMFYAALSFTDMSMYNISPADLSGVVDMLNACADTKLCAFLIEYEEGRVKGSLRSDPFKGVDVSAIARALGGGGHKYAAGFTREGSLAETEDILFEATKSYIMAR